MIRGQSLGECSRYAYFLLAGGKEAENRVRKIKSVWADWWERVPARAVYLQEIEQPVTLSSEYGAFSTTKARYSADTATS